MNSKKKTYNFWIDATKAVCMISVYILHSEVYYGTGSISYGYILMPFYVNAFFFVSGYLLFDKFLYLPVDNLIKINTLKNLFFRLVIPTIIFSGIIYVPKMLFHSESITFAKIFFDIFGGISYWFTSALVVAQLVLLILFLFGAPNISFYLIVTFLIFLVGIWLNGMIELTGSADVYFPWYYRTGLEYTFVMALGGAYLMIEKKVDKILHRIGLVVLATLYAFSLIIGYNDLLLLKFMGLGGNVNFSGFIVVLMGTLLIIGICKKIPFNKHLEFIGRNSIVFYFFSGAMPALIGKIAGVLVQNRIYLVTIIVAFISLYLSYILTILINKYLPFLLDIRKLTIWKVLKS